MILLASALAVSVLLGVVLWKLGQRPPKPLKPGAEGGHEIGQAISLLIFFILAASQTYIQWTDLGSAISHLHGASASDLPGYLADAELARRRLVLYVIGSTVVLCLCVHEITKLTKAFMRRRSDAKAQPQETHA